MTIEWDGSGDHPQRFDGPFTQVRVGDDQVAVFVDEGQLVGSRGPGDHGVTPKTAPFAMSPTVQLFMVSTRPMTAKFGSKEGVTFESPQLSGKLRHFGEWRYRVTNPKQFVHGSLEESAVKIAGGKIGALFDACALEWINGGHMAVYELAANQDKFLEVLPAHIGPAIEPLGLALEDIGGFTVNVG